ncbi:acetyl-CoA acyltransferase [Ignicoccus pacificus DSM 13166]|uniref:Acetyl-CoA acyltransferase n=1 Tax=Ignicoccus pacificus DSM 13166 TaxID=940294 RepID=A0A977PJV9_9CREN|nr:acetyl-CoA acyltransferase [Ignicoccus pacificus DSM 13166]
MVYVCGAKVYPVGRHYDKSVVDMALEVSGPLVRECGEPEAIVFATYLSPFQEDFDNHAQLFAEYLGTDAEVYTVASGDGSGGAAISLGEKLVKAGYKRVLVVGSDKTNDFHSKHAVEQLTTLIAPYERYYGTTYSSVHALAARLYMKRFNLSREELSQWAVVMHSNAIDVPHAQLRFPVKIEKVCSSNVISEPLRLLDAHPFSDGAAAVMLTSESSPVELRTASASSKLTVANRDLTFMDSTYKAMKKLGVDGVDAVEVHDAFSIAGLIALESLGLAERGKAIELLNERPKEINPSGGLKARGHPIGATGVYQVAEGFSAITEGLGRLGKVSSFLTHSTNLMGASTYLTYLKEV